MVKSRVFIMKSVPNGAPVTSDFEIQEKEVPTVQDGELLVKALYISVDPYLIGKLRGISTYTAPFKVGEPVVSRTCAEVVESKDPKFKPGDQVFGYLDWSEYIVTKSSAVSHTVHPDPEICLGVCGGTGLTAYFGLFEIGQPKPTDTVLVSAAAGAVGLAVCQIAKITGCRVVGIAGTDEKCSMLKGLGVDAVINYKKENLFTAVKEACPNGIDVYFDNVGGETLDAAMKNMNNSGRIVACGAISQYTATTPQVGPRHEGVVLSRRLKWQGFIVSDFYEKFPVAYKALLEWHGQGKLKNFVTVHKGFEKLITALLDLLVGGNTGKTIVKV